MLFRRHHWNLGQSIVLSYPAWMIKPVGKNSRNMAELLWELSCFFFGSFTAEVWSGIVCYGVVSVVLSIMHHTCVWAAQSSVCIYACVQTLCLCYKFFVCWKFFRTMYIWICMHIVTKVNVHVMCNMCVKTPLIESGMTQN